MTETREVLRWSTASASVRGSSHRRSDTVNQDAVLVREVGDAVVVAVADGHGSRTHMRSDAGSRLAVEAACSLGAELVEDGLLHRAESDIVTTLEYEAGPALVERWRSAVLDHVADNPWTSEDLAVSPGAAGDPFHGYGTTIMVALAGPDRVAVLQLGDGDVLVGHRSGRATLPVPGDDRLIGNQTTSLCLDSAPDDFRAAAIALDGDPVRFVSITTDGYANSFASENWGEEVGADMLEHLDRDGLPYVAGSLEDWLGESAEIGGDDVTMGLLVADLETIEVEVPEEVDGPVRDLDDLADVTTEVKGRRRGRRRIVLIVLLILLVLGGGVGAAIALFVL
ncbi:MAG: protein phosphatase 2C domain-containing protein [Acidimicrobiales bacterium]|nr:protein phosphatase 2C domain-containing protein [Acidimicrobiales bacterium]